MGPGKAFPDADVHKPAIILKLIFTYQKGRMVVTVIAIYLQFIGFVGFGNGNLNISQFVCFNFFRHQP